MLFVLSVLVGGPLRRGVRGSNVSEPKETDPDQESASDGKSKRVGVIGAFTTSMDEEIRGLLEKLRMEQLAIPDRFETVEARMRLGARIGMAFMIAEDSLDRRGISKTKERRANLAKVERLVAELRAIISERVVLAELSRTIASADPRPPGHRNPPLFMQIAENRRLLAEGARAVNLKRPGPVPGAREQLFVDLAEIFRSEFGADPLAGVNTNYHAPRGPFFTFVQEARRTVREPISGARLVGRSRLTGPEPLTVTALEEGLAAIRKRSSGEV